MWRSQVILACLGRKRSLVRIQPSRQLEGVRMDEETVLKTAGCKSLGGSSPSSSAKLMESCQSGLSCDFAKVVGVTAPQVRILCSPQNIWARCQRQVNSLARRLFGFDSHYVHHIWVYFNGRMLVSKTSD